MSSDPPFDTVITTDTRAKIGVWPRVAFWIGSRVHTQHVAFSVGMSPIVI
jgi:phage major head subunit gpT-like protein